MAAPAEISVCPGCGSRLPAVEGPIHAYMTSSPGCWAAFNAVIAREFSDPDLMAVHRLSVDAWAVFPGRRLMPARTRVFLDTLEAEFARHCPATEQRIARMRHGK